MNFVPLFLFPLKEDNDAFITLILLGVCLGPMIFIAIRNAYQNRFASLWDEGYFPEKLRFNNDTLMEAYICLGARLIRSDLEDMNEKIAYMNSYFNKYFPSSHYDFADSLGHSIRRPIRIKSVIYWLNRNINSKDKRLQLLYFLTGLSMVDGSIKHSEMILLKEIAELLELSPREFRSIISLYDRYEEAFKQATDNPQSISLIEKCCEILGVSRYASKDEIKKAYRSLVKKNHPDRFATESKEQQKIAEERFLKIQKAYEHLERSF